MAEHLYNGIELPDAWPPRDVDLKTSQPQRVPYLESPPDVIPIDGGRQLFVDDYLIERTTMTRVFHHPVKHPGNPVMFPETDDERPAEYPPCAIAKCGGVGFDDRDDRFKMWYMAGYVGWMVYAESDDGLHWRRPKLDVVPGTNLCLPRDLHPDSGTVWIDRDTDDPTARYKMLLREPNSTVAVPSGMTSSNAPGLLMTSPDGIHWSAPAPTGPMGDRSTMFYNPFRKTWVQSIRGSASCGRCRLYFENENFLKSGQWKKGEPVPWARADCLDEAGDSLPQLYNLDAVAYESLMIGFFQILKGPPNNVCQRAGMPKLTELVVATSRDGFHWHRPDRRAFIGANRVPGSWEYGYVEPSGGVCLVVGDELWFYYSAYGGDLTRKDEEDGLKNGMYGNGAVGLAKLRRDGFASMSPRFPEAELTTRPLTFSGDRLFVNVNTAGGELTVEAIDQNGEPVPGCSFEECIPFRGNATRTEIRWKTPGALSAVNGNPVRLHFKMDRGDLYAFWVSSSPAGESGGYLAAGGPGIKGNRDVLPEKGVCCDGQLE